MKFKPIFAAFALFLSLASFAKAAPLSAKRASHESYLEAISRVHLRLRSMRQPDGNVAAGMTAYDSRVGKISELNSSVVAEVASLEVLQEIFETYRDLRYIPDPDVSGFQRRLSWMYPDDGCFARAELFGFLAEKDQQPRISKIFVFGDLVAPTPNHPQGQVNWWYHVAPLYRIGQELYVMDPAIEPSRPLTRAEWAMRIGEKGQNEETSLEWAICSAHTFDPSSNCQNVATTSESSALGWISSYLSSERYRMIQLERDVEQVLGDHPPWITPLVDTPPFLSVPPVETAPQTPQLPPN